MRKIAIILATLVILFSLLISSCGSDTPTGSTSGATTTSSSPTDSTPTKTISGPSTTPASIDAQPQYGGTLRFLYTFSPKSNIGWPQDIHGNADEYVINYVYAEPLVLYKADTTVEPYLATSWELADDFRSITFQLRQGVKFHDGTDFNAEAVKWNFDEAIKANKANAANLESVEVIDQYTVKFNLKKFENNIWDELTASESMIVAPAPSIEYAREHPCGTGPFNFVSWARDEYVKFERNPNY